MVKTNLSHTHKIRFWYLSGVFQKFTMITSIIFLWEFSPPPPLPSPFSLGLQSTDTDVREWDQRHKYHNTYHMLMNEIMNDLMKENVHNKHFQDNPLPYVKCWSFECSS